MRVRPMSGCSCGRPTARSTACIPSTSSRGTSSRTTNPGTDLRTTHRPLAGCMSTHDLIEVPNRSEPPYGVVVARASGSIRQPDMCASADQVLRADLANTARTRPSAPLLPYMGWETPFAFERYSPASQHLRLKATSRTSATTPVGHLSQLCMPPAIRPRMSNPTAVTAASASALQNFCMIGVSDGGDPDSDDMRASVNLRGRAADVHGGSALYFVPLHVRSESHWRSM